MKQDSTMLSAQSPLGLSFQDTNILKGVALILLLIHHLFYTGEMPVDDVLIHGHSLVRIIGIWCKLCVAIFVFLSGYGLTKGAEKNGGGIGSLWQFYKKRYLKLMMNYWFIYLLFVPFGVFVMGRTFTDVYHDSMIRPILDFFGLHFAVTGDYYGYNATWWFYGCIISLYLLYPLLYTFRKEWYFVIPASVLFMLHGYRIPILWACCGYIIPFVLGMYMAMLKSPYPIVSKYQRCAILIIFLLCCVERIVNYNPILWDSVIIVTGVMTYKAFIINRYIKLALAFIGKHSFNIFLFHTFIYAYYFKEFIYWSSNPLLIFFTLLTTCLIVSIVLEWAKEKLGINKLQSLLIVK